MGPKKKKNQQGVCFGGVGIKIAIFFNDSGVQLLHSNIRNGVYVVQQQYFRQVVTNCACALANGQQNGRILIGHYNNGFMMGYNLPAAEKERLRTEAVAAIKDVRPPLPGKDYVLQFVPFYDFFGRPQGNTEFLAVDIRGTSKWSNAEQRQMYRNANQEIYICTGLNVHEAKGHEIEAILQRRHQRQKDRLVNNFKRELEKLQDEKGKLEDNLKNNTYLLQRKRDEFEVTMQKEAETNQRDDINKQFQREIKGLEEIVERQKKELEDKQDAFNKVMLEIDYAKASDDLDDLDLEDNDKKGDESEEENGETRSDEENGSEDKNEQENGSADSVQSPRQQKKSQLKTDKGKRKDRKSSFCVVA